MKADKLTSDAGEGPRRGDSASTSLRFGSAPATAARPEPLRYWQIIGADSPLS